MSVRPTHLILRICRPLFGIMALCASAAIRAEPPSSGCQTTDIPLTVTERSNSDLYLSPKITGGKTHVVFVARPPSNVLGKRTIVDEQPEYAIARLSDGSGLQFDRDCRGVKCVYLGLKVAPKATDCWAWSSTDNPAEKRSPAVRFVLASDKMITSGRKDGADRLVLRSKDASGRVTVEPLIVTSRPIVGFGVGLPTIEGGFRTIDVIKREEDGSLSLVSYGFVNR